MSHIGGHKTTDHLKNIDHETLITKSFGSTFLYYKSLRLQPFQSHKYALKQLKMIYGKNEKESSISEHFSIFHPFLINTSLVLLKRSAGHRKDTFLFSIKNS